jgi:hypothetical protein
VRLHVPDRGYLARNCLTQRVYFTDDPRLACAIISSKLATWVAEQHNLDSYTIEAIT